MLFLGGICLLLAVGNVKAETIDADSDASTTTATMYIKTSTYPGDIVVNEEITQEEYDIIGTDQEIVPYKTVETNAKKLTLSVSHISGSTYNAFVETEWKYIPKIKSYDVSAIRLNCFDPVYAATTSGRQFYDGETITYSYTGTNINKFANGFGISMNIVDSTSSSLSTLISTNLTKDSSCSSGSVHGTYQHATSAVTLAQSKDYYLYYTGKGGVIEFYEEEIADMYDSTPGLTINVEF